VPENIIPAPLSEVPNSNYYGLTTTITTWTSETENLPTIMDLGDVKVMSDKKCSVKCSKLTNERINIHWRFLCSIIRPFILLEHVSN
jgi:hypothetical protein